MITYEQRCAFRRLLESHHWIFAKTMPHNPHHYTLRKGWTDSEFVETVKVIREHGYNDWYKGRLYRAMNFNDRKYWTMGSPIPETILINTKPAIEPQPYDIAANEYDEIYSDEYFLKEDQEVADFINYQGGTVLDIGCGTGLLTQMLNLNPLDYTGIDPSSQMIQRFGEKRPEFKDRLIVTPFEDFSGVAWGEKFDYVIALYGVSSYIKPETLSRVHEMVKPTGKVFMMFYEEGYEAVVDAAKAIKIPNYHEQGVDAVNGFKERYHRYVIVRG